MPRDEKKPNKSLILDVVVAIELQQGGKGVVEPFVGYRFPKSSCDDRFVASVIQFCFPDIADFPKETMESETFSFVLTESAGDRRFGYCLRVLPRGAGLRLPICFCVLSFYPCYSLFSSVLEEIAARYNKSSDSISTFLTSLLKNRFPAPGESFTVTIDQTEQRFTRPDDNDYQLDHVNLEPLLTTVDPANIMKIFASLLVERRVIFSSAKLSTLSSCIQATIALLYPLNWQHIYIPVLPKTLLTFCCAPMPFVVGVLESFLPEVGTLPLEQVLIIDLDDDTFLRTPDGSDFKLLPPSLSGPLQKTVTAVCKTVKKNRKKRKKDAEPGELAESKKILTDAFVAFFVDLLASYRDFITPDGFDRERFVESQPPDARQFLELFVCSQMFERFIEERAGRGSQPTNNGAFESRVSLYQSITNKVGSQQAADQGGRHWTLYEENYLQKKDAKPVVEEKKSFTDYFKAKLNRGPSSGSTIHQPKSSSAIFSSGTGDDLSEPEPPPTKPRISVGLDKFAIIQKPKFNTLNSRFNKFRPRSRSIESLDDLAIPSQEKQPEVETPLPALKSKAEEEAGRKERPRPPVSVMALITNRSSAKASPTLMRASAAPLTLQTTDSRKISANPKPAPSNAPTSNGVESEEDIPRRHRRRSSLPDVKDLKLIIKQAQQYRESARVNKGSHIGPTPSEHQTLGSSPPSASTPEVKPLRPSPGAVVRPLPSALAKVASTQPIQKSLSSPSNSALSPTSSAPASPALSRPTPPAAPSLPKPAPAPPAPPPGPKSPVKTPKLKPVSMKIDPASLAPLPLSSIPRKGGGSPSSDRLLTPTLQTPSSSGRPNNPGLSPATPLLTSASSPNLPISSTPSSIPKIVNEVAATVGTPPLRPLPSLLKPDTARPLERSNSLDKPPSSRPLPAPTEPPHSVNAGRPLPAPTPPASAPAPAPAATATAEKHHEAPNSGRPLPAPPKPPPLPKFSKAIYANRPLPKPGSAPTMPLSKALALKKTGSTPPTTPPPTPPTAQAKLAGPAPAESPRPLPQPGSLPRTTAPRS